MKRTIYISLFTFLGILVQQLFHALTEMWVVYLLTSNFDRFGLGLSWDQWFLVHKIGSVALFTAGLTSGYLAGRYFWKVIYEKP